MDCRHCRAPLVLPLVDLGTAPPSNAYLTASDLKKPEVWFPLRILVCTQCWLVQTEDYARAEEIFTSDYAYFSSVSSSWLEHAANYVVEVVERFRLDQRSKVIEIAANDGYLLQYVAARGIPCIGVEPTASTAAKAREKGIEIIEDFFGTRLAQSMVDRDIGADLVVANNVLAHVPDINDFVHGIALLLKNDGVVTFEFPHLLNLVAENQFDTIYHEHFSYLSLGIVDRICRQHGLSVFDVVPLTTHGGSLRVYAQRVQNSGRPTEAVEALLRREEREGLRTTGYYAGFQGRVDKTRSDLVEFLVDVRRAGKKLVAYGAAAKGSTLINYAGVRSDLIPFVVDKSPAKQGRFLPGSRIPIVGAEKIQEEKPDYVLILPWNLREEIETDLRYVRGWDGRFVTAIPGMRVG